jgi:hypothetical protein
MHYNNITSIEQYNEFNSKFSIIELTSNSAKNFISKVDAVIYAISNQPYIYKSSNFNDKVRKATITKQCSLFYEINNENIQLSYFWDNRQKPII